MSYTTVWHPKLMRLAALLACFAATPAYSQDKAIATDAGWNLLWADEFDGAALDTGNWSYMVGCWGGGNHERQCYTDDAKNAVVKDGVLSIIALPGEITGSPLSPDSRAAASKSELAAQISKPFSSARLRTRGKRDWRYGRMEIRAKLPVGQGVWPAIWMMPSEDVYGAWPLSGEIDIMEAINLGAVCDSCKGGRENRIHGTIHFGARPPGNVHKGAFTAMSDSKDGFHTYAAEWSKDRITWFVDDVPYSTLTSDSWYSAAAENDRSAPFDRAFHMILNVAIGGDWPENENEKGVADITVPKIMQIDWVRVYQCTQDRETGAACMTAVSPKE